MGLKVVKTGDSEYGLDLDYPVFDQINAVQAQRATGDMNAMLRSQGFKDLTKSMGQGIEGNVAGALAIPEFPGFPGMAEMMEQTVREMEKDFENSAKADDHAAMPKVRALVGWFDTVAAIQEKTARQLQSIQQTVVEALNQSVFKYVNANLRSINQEIGRSGGMLPRISKLAKKEDAVGLYGIGRILLHPSEAQCKLVASMQVHAYEIPTRIEATVSPFLKPAGIVISTVTLEVPTCE